MSSTGYLDWKQVGPLGLEQWQATRGGTEFYRVWLEDDNDWRWRRMEDDADPHGISAVSKQAAMDAAEQDFRIR
jgi:predicted glycosyl hydrolase (DUF1957 family)